MAMMGLSTLRRYGSRRASATFALGEIATSEGANVTTAQPVAVPGFHAAASGGMNQGRTAMRTSERALIIPLRKWCLTLALSGGRRA
jgi:hypothetical protein